MWRPKYLNTDHVLYVAIADAIEVDIQNGKLQAHEKMPTQRSIADIIGVNLTTVTRAYNLAKKRGHLYAVTGRGTFVAQADEVVMPVLGEVSHKIIDLGLVGSVNLNSYDINSKISRMLLDANMGQLLDYTSNEGLYEHRLAGQKWIEAHGVSCKVDNVMICAGVMHAVSCIQAGLMGYDDAIAVDSLTFTGFLNLSQLNNRKLVAIEMDDEGMVPHALDQACSKGNIKGVYLMPNLQNPTGTRMSSARQEAIAKVIEKHSLILIEDDAYNLFESKERHCIANIIPESTIYICGTSKTLFPGLRIAYCYVPEQYKLGMKQAIMSNMWMVSPICAEISAQLINEGIAFKMAKDKRGIIRRRIEIVKDLFSEFDIEIHDCSQFFWLKLPDSISALEFESIALDNKVRVMASDKFSIDRTDKINAIRISIAHIKEDESLEKGLRIILAIIKNPMAYRRVIM